MNFLRLGINSVKFAKTRIICPSRALFSTGVVKHNKVTKQIDVDEEDEALNKPYSYTNSEASKWPAKWSRYQEKDVPPYHDFVISASLAAFLVYFCILREESDIDLIFTKDLSDYMPELSQEEFQKVITPNKPMAFEDYRSKV